MPPLMPLFPPPLVLPCTLVMALALTGCSSLQSSYQTPPVQTPHAWQAGSNSTAAHTTPAPQANQPIRLENAWWTQFGDARLNQLIATALQQNADLVTAGWNIQLARINAGLAHDRATPSLGASISSNASHNLDAGSTSRNHSVGLNLSYEVDLWGKIASQQNAAQWRLHASEHDLQATALALVANIATLYWQLGYQNEQITTARQSLAHARRTQELVQAQYSAGSVSGLEVQEARRAIATQESALAQLQQERINTLGALAVLLNQPPNTASLAAVLPHEPQTLPDANLAPVPEALPAQLLQRRPDLQAAEARLRATLADGDATRLSYYPAISLTAGLGSASNTLGNLLSNPIGTLGASLALPFLNQTQMRLSNQASQATFEAASAGFQKTFYIALQEVEQALGTRNQLQTQAHWLQEQLSAARQAEQLYEVRYRTGAASLKNWLDAQESRRSAELAASANRLSQLINQTTLYKALGGDMAFDAPANTPAAPASQNPPSTLPAPNSIQ